MNKTLKWEIDWVNNNKYLYDSDTHASSVIENIKKRYYIKNMNKLVKCFAEKRTTGAMFNLLDYCAN